MMGILDFFKPKRSRQEVAEAVAEATFRTLQDPQFEEDVIQALRQEGCESTREEIIREIYYLLQLGNHIAFLAHTRDVAKGTDLLQRCSNRMNVLLNSIGVWPEEESIHVSAEYHGRMEKLLEAMEETPKEVSRDVPGASAYPPVKVITTKLLGPGKHPLPILMTLSALLMGQINGCRQMFKSIRIA